MSKIVLRCQMYDVLDGIALGLVGEEIGTRDVIEGQIVEPPGTVAKAKMDCRFDYSVRIGYSLERANVNVVIVDLPDGNADVVAETSEIFIYRIAIGLNLHFV